MSRKMDSKSTPGKAEAKSEAKAESKAEAKAESKHKLEQKKEDSKREGKSEHKPVADDSLYKFLMVHPSATQRELNDAVCARRVQYIEMCNNDESTTKLDLYNEILERAQLLLSPKLRQMYDVHGIKGLSVLDNQLAVTITHDYNVVLNGGPYLHTIDVPESCRKCMGSGFIGKRTNQTVWPLDYHAKKHIVAHCIGCGGNEVLLTIDSSGSLVRRTCAPCVKRNDTVYAAHKKQVPMYIPCLSCNSNGNVKRQLVLKASLVGGVLPHGEIVIVDEYAIFVRCQLTNLPPNWSVVPDGSMMQFQYTVLLTDERRKGPSPWTESIALPDGTTYECVVKNEELQTDLQTPRTLIGRGLRYDINRPNRYDVTIMFKIPAVINSSSGANKNKSSNSSSSTSDSGLSSSIPSTILSSSSGLSLTSLSCEIGSNVSESTSSHPLVSESTISESISSPLLPGSESTVSSSSST